MRPARLILLSALIPLCLGLSGCGIPGGIAYAIKQADKDEDSGQAQSSAPAPAAQQTRAAEPPPAPPPTPAKRESIQVEELK